MAFTEREISDHLRVLEDCFWSKRRPPLHLRNQIREGQRFLDQSIELLFVRPHFRNPEVWIEEAFAKVRYVRKQNIWRLYWHRADGKWHGYTPHPEAKSLAQALRVINQDALHCFFG